jgi:hypothetical protein
MEKPPHMLDTSKSWVYILPERTWSRMSSTNVQRKLRTHGIIIESDTEDDFVFDRELFVNMLGHGNMKYLVSMEGKLLY